LGEKPPPWEWQELLLPLVDLVRAAVSRVWGSLRLHHVHYAILAGILCLTLLLVLREARLGPSADPIEVVYLTPLRATPVPTRVTDPTPAVRTARHHPVVQGLVVTRQPTPTPAPQTAFESPIAEPSTPAPPDDGVRTYIVQAGDDLTRIAARFGLQRETLIWANKRLEADPGTLYVGQELYILPVDGVYYTVQQGDTWPGIAERLQVPVEAILNSVYNAHPPLSAQPEAGRKVVVPGGVKPFKPQEVRLPPQPTPSAPAQGTGSWVWPVGGYISQGYWDLHRAIDIATRHGESVMAADAGTVVYAEWGWAGYGNLVVIDHGNGFRSYYGHLYGFYVEVGEQVERGQPLGALGNTGLSTGPHLHFEIRQDGVLRDPLDYLP
jgi:murein DD-endopeptidase MepM/ murein hydrolase activator NlpD